MVTNIIQNMLHESSYDYQPRLLYLFTQTLACTVAWKIVGKNKNKYFLYLTNVTGPERSFCIYSAVQLDKAVDKDRGRFLFFRVENQESRGKWECRWLTNVFTTHHNNTCSPTLPPSKINGKGRKRWRQYQIVWECWGVYCNSAYSISKLDNTTTKSTIKL